MFSLKTNNLWHFKKDYHIWIENLALPLLIKILLIKNFKRMAQRTIEEYFF